MSINGEMSVHGIVLAGVHQWGEMVFDRVAPRPLLPIMQMPLIGFSLRWMRQGGIERATICANSHSRAVRRCLGDGRKLSMALDYFEDAAPRGPGGCVRDAGAVFPADHFVVVEGTVIPQLDMGGLLTSHMQSGAAVTIAVREARDPDGGPAKWTIPVGVYVFARRVFELIPAIGYQDIKEVLIPRLNDESESVVTFIADGPCPRVSSAASYLAVNEWMLEESARSGHIAAGYSRREQAILHDSAVIDPTVRLIGPVFVGPRSRIGRGTMVVGPTSIGADCVVETDGLVCRSVLWNGSVVGAGSRLDHCIVCFDSSVAGAFSQTVLHTPSGEKRVGSDHEQALGVAAVDRSGLSTGRPVAARTAVTPDEDSGWLSGGAS